MDASLRLSSKLWTTGYDTYCHAMPSGRLSVNQQAASGDIEASRLKMTAHRWHPTGG